MRNVIFALAAGLFLAGMALDAGAATGRTFAPFAPGEVRVGGEIGRRMEVTVDKMLRHTDIERTFIRHFRERKAEPEMFGGFAGYGMFLDALVKAAAHGVGGEATVAAKTRLLAELAATQSADGRITMFLSEPGFWDAHEGVYLIQAYVNDHRWFGCEASLATARRLADSLIARKADMTLGCETAFALLAAETGERKYRDWLETAFIVRSDIDAYDRALSVNGVQHVYTWLARALGQLDYADLVGATGGERARLSAAAEEAYARTREPYMSVTGSMTGKPQWGENWDATQVGLGKWGETCATAYLMRLTARSMERFPEAARGDLFEQAMYNAFFSAQSADGLRYRYFTPFNEPAPWYGQDTYCCPNNYRREVFEIPDAVFFRTADGLAVNLYSEATLKADGVSATMRTSYPDEGDVSLTVTMRGRVLRLRIPAWCEGATVAVDGGAPQPAEPGWFALERDFSTPVRVDLKLPMAIRLVPGVRAQEGRVAVLRGPCVHALAMGGEGRPVPSVDLWWLDPSEPLVWNAGTRTIDATFLYRNADRPRKRLSLVRYSSDFHDRTYFDLVPKAEKKSPVKIVFDTDMLGDFDDVGALACLHRLADLGECEILATVSSTRGNASVGAIEVVNHYYGRGDLPVGAPKGMGVVGVDVGCTEKVDPRSPLGEPGPRNPNRGHYKYRKLVADYPQGVKHLDADDAPDANETYRRALASAPDGSVVVCTVGFLTNVRRLLETKPDAISPLDGRALVAKKVRKWVAMACRYPQGREFNSEWDPESSRIAFERWPTPIVFSDWQYGCDVFAGRGIAEKDCPRNPVKDVFADNLPPLEEIRKDEANWCKRCFGIGGRSAWDETAVLAAVRGETSYFNLERGTYRMVGTDGENVWTPSPDGPHVRLTEKTPKDEVGRIIDDLISAGLTAAVETTPGRSEATRTFMSYNVCECFGNYQVKGLGKGDRSPERYTNRLEAITRLIRAASPEWCALQEVCHDLTNGVDHVSRFAARTGMHVEFADSASTWPGRHFGGGWGVALLSKKPPLKVRRFVAGRSEKYPRTVLAAEFEDYVVYAAHFTFADPYRMETIADVEAELAKETKPVFLVGDLNLQPSEKELFARLQEKFTILTDGTGNTWPAVDPTQRLDYILVDKPHAEAWHKLRAWSLSEKEASDHRPIFLELAPVVRE